MRINTFYILSLIVLIVGCNNAKQNKISKADIIYVNAKVYTINNEQPWVEAVAIKDGKILAVGSTSEINAFKGENTLSKDLKGKFVIPGLVDTHTHPIISSIDILNGITIDPVPSNLKEIQDQVWAYIESKPGVEWVIGAAWPKGLFPMENPMREWLDEVSTEIPITLMDQGGHAYWCNTLALKKAGIMSEDFEAPPFAIIERDENGIPSGTVRETALGVVRQAMPKVPTEIILQAAKASQIEFNKNGVTATRTADGNQDHLMAIKKMADNEEITMHWAVDYDLNYFDSYYTPEEQRQQVKKRDEFASEFIGTNFAKIFVDGELNGYGIKMKKPFEGTDDEYGKMSITPEELKLLVREYDQKGISIQFHAIGSQSIEEVILALEEAAEYNGGELKTRHYPDHTGFPDEDQIKRLVKVNGLIGYAPYFSFTFPGVHESYIQFVGKERVYNMQPLRTSLDAGAIIGTGTDYSSLPQDPWPLIEGMVNRKNPWDENSEANNSSESITLAEALHIYTLGGAHAMLKEDNIGSIEVGKYADFIVLNQNLFEIQEKDISETEVLLTVFNGKEVYAKN